MAKKKRLVDRVIEGLLPDKVAAMAAVVEASVAPKLLVDEVEEMEALLAEDPHESAALKPRCTHTHTDKMNGLCKHG